MTINDALKQGNSILFYAEVDTPALDGSLLLAESLGITKERLYASLADEIEADTFIAYKELLDKRCSGYPVSYILHKKEFYGLEFFVDERVLVPRPDTETVVETVTDFIMRGERIDRLIDVCTGSGCIAITLKKIFSALDVCATDISWEALAVVDINAKKILGMEIRTRLSDLLENVEGEFDCIVSNPPYLGSEEVVRMKKIGWPEPEAALLGGESGIEITAKLIGQASQKLARPGWLALESAPEHMNDLRAIMKREGYVEIRVNRDLANNERVIVGKLT